MVAEIKCETKEQAPAGRLKTVLLVDFQTRQVVQTFHAMSDALYNFYYPFAFAKEEEVIVALTDTALKI